MKCKETILPKFVAIALFLFIIAAITSIWSNPIYGYELSIFNSFSYLTWVLIIGPVIGGVGFIVYGVYRKENYWQVGLLLIILVNLIIVLLPYLKGYAFSGNGDHLSHFGSIKDILNTGNFSTNDVYPVTHILSAQLSSILSITPEIMINFIGSLFYLLFILFSYLLAREVMPKPAAVLSTTASTVLFSHYYNQIFPMGFAFIFFPLAFYLYFRYLNIKSSRIAILLIIVLLLMVFFHPVSSFILTVSLLVMEVGRLIYSRLFRDKSNIRYPYSYHIKQISFNFAAISFICLMVWIWNKFGVWNSAVISVVSWFNTELFVKPMTEIAQDAFNKLGLSLSGQLGLFLKSYGAHFIYLGLSVIAIIMLIVGKFNIKKEYHRNLFIYACFFLPVVAIWLTDYVRPLTTLSSGRMICVVIAMFPILVGLALYKIGGFETEKNEESLKSTLTRGLKWKLTKAVSTGIIIVICSIIAILAFYPSPYRYQAYWGVSYSSFNSETWLLHKGNPDLTIIGIALIPPDRIADAVWGIQRGKIKYPHLSEETLYDHFGYDHNQNLGQSISNDRYLFLGALDKLFYTKLYPGIGLFNLNDFARLENDPSVNRIYSNGKAQDYYIRLEE